MLEVLGGAKATIQNLTIANGFAQGVGGGIYNLGTLGVINSTFSGNSASSGGGIINFGTLGVTNSTFSGNSADYGGSIVTADTANLKNTIMAKSTSGGDCFGTTINDNNYNIADDSSCNFTAPNSKNNTDPLFAGELADNGGPTQTIALQPSSPAVDAIPPGTNGYGTDITTDQRGVSRPQGTGCDIGAFELNNPLSSWKHHKHRHHKPGHHKRHHGCGKGHNKHHHKKHNGGGGK